METATIDLGELPGGKPIDLDAPWPVLERLRRLRPRHLRWAVAAAGIAALVLVTTGAAAGKPLPALTLQAVFPHTGFALDQENLYLLEGPEPPAATALTAYALATGAVRWRLPLPEIEYGWVETDGALLLVTAALAADGGDLVETSRVDPDTGRRLWTREGSPGERSGDLVLLRRAVPADVSDDELPPRYEVSAVSLRTGEPAWTRELSGWGSYVPGDPDRLLVFAHGGRLESYDFQTGRLLRSAQVPADDLVELVAVGPVVFRFHPQERSELTAYGVDALTPLWTLEGGEATWPVGCGRLVCVTGAGPIRAVQPTTGETVWSADWLPEGSVSDPVQIDEPDHAALDGYLQLTHTYFDGRSLGSWLIDAGTGERVLDLRRWVLASPSSGPVPEHPMATKHGDGVTWVGRLRPDLSGVDPIGAIETEEPVSPDAPYPYCLIPDGFLICETYPATDTEPAVLRVWRIR